MILAAASLPAGSSFSTATELANYLVKEEDMSFRAAYQVVGDIVKKLSRQGKTFADIETASALCADAGLKITHEALTLTVDPIHVLRRQLSMGSTGPDSVAAMISQLNAEISRNRQSVLKTHFLNSGM